MTREWYPIVSRNNQLAETGDKSDFIHALNTAARAMGMTEVAKKAGATRANLYKSLAEDGNPKFSTICKVTKALGCKLVVVSAAI